ncbi:MAG: HNH endonuclease [Candidatus Eremiobacteraeota bacterium]|nr:HNH endonuclease [Candidatus Eremiobacteraeota bacterium]
MASLPLSGPLEGRIAKSALRHLSRVATPENECWWLTIAEVRSLCGLEREVKRALAEGKAGSAAPSDDAPEARDEGTMMYFSVPPSLALTWDFALSLFRDRCFEKLWKYFSDVDELRDAEASMEIEKDSCLCAGLGNQSGSDHLYAGACNGKEQAAHHHKILKRDRFRCQAPGCRCRRNLHVHHIIRRSQGGTDDPWNLITLCEACHLHLLHGLRTLTMSGKAPYDLTFTFGSLSGGTPFLVYAGGAGGDLRRVTPESPRVPEDCARNTSCLPAEDHV